MATGIHWRFWDRGRDDCAAIEPLLSLYADDMASPAEMRRVEAHLDGCDDCRQALGWMQATRRAISSRPAVTPPPELRARIARAIAELEAAKAPARPAHRPVTLRPALGYGFATALIAAAGWGLWNAGGPAQVAVHPAPPPTVVATTGGQPSSGHVPTTVPALRVKTPTPHSPAVPRVASRETPETSHVVVRRHPAAPVVPPTVMTASGDTGRRLTPPRLSPVTALTHFTVVPRHASRAVPASQGPLLATNTSQNHPRRPTMTPPHTETGPLVANVPPTQTLPDVPPPSVRIQSPTVTPDVQVHTASLAPSVNDTLRGIAVSWTEVQHRVSLTGRGFAANERTVAATVSLATADSSGTAPITEGPVR